MLVNFSKENNSLFSGLVIPNVYGPFGHPYYNSFIATFAHQLTHNETPEIHIDGDVRLIYVGNLCKFIINRIRQCAHTDFVGNDETIFVPYDFEKKVSELKSENNRMLDMEYQLVEHKYFSNYHQSTNIR